MVAVVTCAVVAALGGLLTVMSSVRLVSMLSALAGVASVGVAVWAGLPGQGARVRVSNTGRAVAGAGGRAVSGVTGPADEVPGGVEVDRSGEADASAGGDATSGIRLT